MFFGRLWWTKRDIRFVDAHAERRWGKTTRTSSRRNCFLLARPIVPLQAGWYGASGNAVRVQWRQMLRLTGSK